MSINYAPSLNHLNSCAVYYDPGNTRSYSGSGGTINTLVGSVTGVSIQPPPTYSSTNGGILVLSGVSAADGTITSTYPRSFATNAVFPHTLEIVIKPTGTPAVNECVLMLGVWATNNHILVRSLSNELQVHAFNTTIIHNYQMTNNNWYHVVSTYDGTTSSLYINGKLIASAAATLRIANKGIYLFGNVPGYDDFEGSVGIVRMYNTCLSAADTIDAFNSVRGRYGL